MASGKCSFTSHKTISIVCICYDLTKEMEELFGRLVAIPSISGNESFFQQLVAKEFSAYSHVKFSDILNNFTVQVGEGTEKVLITAHADEVGFIVTYIDDNGFIYF